jgi:prepilin-type N-terminal cleavage/methylation domain-containing protein
MKAGAGQAGFSLIELLIVMFGIVAITGVTIPQFNNLLESQRARNAARVVERELQSARLTAVSASRPLRVRFNCPAAGQLRTLEVTGIAATDNATNRCSPVAYPTPGPNDGLQATPSLDSPVAYLPTGTTVTGTTLGLEFGPKGTVHLVDASGTPTVLGGDLSITVTRYGHSRTVTVNALGRVRLN